MTLNERILDFLDGSLPPDDEAELLHTLSVSPEKRSLMRGFMDQRALLVRDSKSLTVPYQAEQRLWSRLDMLMPSAQSVTNAAETLTAAGTKTAGLLARAFSASSARVGSLALFAGIGIGFFAGKNSVMQPAPVVAVKSITPEQISSARYVNQQTQNRAPHSQYVASYYNGNAIFGFLPNFPANNFTPEKSAGSPAPAALNEIADGSAISNVNARQISPVSLADIGGDGSGIKPLFHKVYARREEAQSILQRFEFQVDESFGRQFPNSAETNVSLPLITNTSLSAMFQILPHSTLLWAGGAYGTANVTRKTLGTTAGNPIDPLQDVLTSDTVHSATSYIAALAELRLPAFATADLTFTGGYGRATLGQMLFGEIGIHYDITSTAGIQTGLRVLRFTYDLTPEKNSAISSGTSGLVIPNAVASASPSYNTELNAGLFFHF